MGFEDCRQTKKNGEAAFGASTFVKDQEEQAVLVQFEATKRCGAYSSGELRAFQSAQTQLTSGVGPVAVPKWFIPSYEVELGDFLSQGSFGAVYRGRWFETEVVIKTLLRNSVEQRRAFVQEADIWFTLNHPHVIQLYGACHVGPRPFFVCEYAGEGTLTSFLACKRRGFVWSRLYEAALGLQFLHRHGIVHGDLKGNNILIGANGKAKLTDFGLSRFGNRRQDISSLDGVGALGAYRWKAPECLSGGQPTFESDVYSFAMCIIEAVSGQLPWGNKLDDDVVKFYVRRGDLPQRAPGFSDAEWDLVKRMCCFKREERVDMAVVVEILNIIQWRKLPRG